MAAKPADKPEGTAVPAAGATTPEALPPAASTAAATPEPPKAGPVAATTPVPVAAPAATPSAATPAGPESTGSIKPNAGAKKAARPRHAAPAPQPKHKTKLAKPAPKPKPPVRRIVRRAAPQQGAPPGYSYSNWSTVNAQWSGQPAWQTPAQRKVR